MGVSAIVVAGKRADASSVKSLKKVYYASII